MQCEVMCSKSINFGNYANTRFWIIQSICRMEKVTDSSFFRNSPTSMPPEIGSVIKLIIKNKIDLVSLYLIGACVYV